MEVKMKGRIRMTFLISNLLKRKTLRLLRKFHQRLTQNLFMKV